MPTIGKTEVSLWLKAHDLKHGEMSDDAHSLDSTRRDSAALILPERSALASPARHSSRLALHKDGS